MEVFCFVSQAFHILEGMVMFSDAKRVPCSMLLLIFHDIIFGIMIHECGLLCIDDEQLRVSIASGYSIISLYCFISHWR